MTKNFILSYDIADEKRLRKIAKLVEKKAFRIQKSIYFLEDFSQDELTTLLDEISKILHDKQDDLRIYTIKQNGIHLGSAINLDEPYMFI